MSTTPFIKTVGKCINMYYALIPYRQVCAVTYSVNPENLHVKVYLKNNKRTIVISRETGQFGSEYASLRIPALTLADVVAAVHLLSQNIE